MIEPPSLAFSMLRLCRVAQTAAVDVAQCRHLARRAGANLRQILITPASWEPPVYTTKLPSSISRTCPLKLASFSIVRIWLAAAKVSVGSPYLWMRGER